MIRAYLVGEKEVIAKLDRLYPDVRARLRVTVEKMAVKLAGLVKSNYLSGQSLQNRTGHLRASVNERMQVTDNEVAALVGPNTPYAAYQEFGFSGSVSVKEHLMLMTQAWGRPLAAPRQVTVSAHSRNVNYAGHPYMRPALASMRDEIRAEIERAVRI